jgi:serine/threonine protein kinase
MPLSLEQILNICRDTAAGMAHLVFHHLCSDIDLIQHAEGIVHRDLACRNLLLTKTDEVKIVDFGMSRWTRDEATTKRYVITQNSVDSYVVTLDH